MVLTRESPRARWFILATTWLLGALLATWHTFAMRDYVAMLDSVGAAPAGATPLRRPLPGAFSDAHTWTRYAIAAQEGGPWQVRFTDTDNAPRGREVHWNSLFVHAISVAGRIQQKFAGGSLAHATEDALAWFNLPLLLACVIGFSAWAAARAGAGAGVLVACGMIGHRSFYDGFTPNYVDHHGILTAAAFGVVLGALFMGAGWWRATAERPQLLPTSPDAAKRAAIVSGLCGAAGMWISAASMIPVIALVGLAGLVVVFLFGDRAQRESAKFDPGLWRWWGRVGAGASCFFYLVEYAPAHIGLRLEANHPFHALAWWGGAELIAAIAAWRIDRTRAPLRVPQLVPALLALAAAPLTVAVFGTAAFMVRDPFVADLRHTVGEGMSFRASAQAFGPDYAQRHLINFLLAGLALVLMWLTRRDRIVFGFVAAVLVGMVAMACWEIRWWLAASAPFLCVWLALAVVMTANQGQGGRWLIIVVMAVALLPFGALGGARTLRNNVRAKTVDELDLLEPLYRDLARALRAPAGAGDAAPAPATQPAEIVLLASPDASTGIGYYGRIKTLGTLSWENTAGLKAAAAIYCAETDDEARELMRARGVTHIAAISKANYVAEYFRLARPEMRNEDVQKTFGHRVFIQQRIPRWLRAMPYRPPANMSMPNLSVLLLRVVGEQNEFEAAWTLATAQVLGGTPELADKNFRHAISLAPAEQRPAMFQNAGDLAHRNRAPAVAVRLYRAGLALSNDPRLAGNLAWLLATSSDTAVRNGREALALVEPAWKANPNDVGLLNTVAAALAETGRFADATNVAARAVELFRPAGNPQTVALLQQRVETYRAGRPWRE